LDQIENELKACEEVTFEALQSFAENVILDGKGTVVDVYGHGNISESTVLDAHRFTREVLARGQDYKHTSSSSSSSYSSSSSLPSVSARRVEARIVRLPSQAQRTVISNGSLNVKEKNGAAFCYWQVGETTHRRAALLQVREIHFNRFMPPFFLFITATL
jgi:hypothetical protein